MSENRTTYDKARIRGTLSTAMLGFVITLGLSLSGPMLGQSAVQSARTAADAPHTFTADEVQSTFPPSVYFQGRTAPLQLRNAAAIRFPGNAIFFAGLVDSSGYASSIQEKYQMYVIAEKPVLVGGKSLQAGAYGAGFVGDRFLVMDLGGRTIAEGSTQTDSQMSRPRPLQLVQVNGTSLKLYLGRRYVSVELGR